MDHESKSSFLLRLKLKAFAGTFEVIKERSISISYSRPKTNDPIFDKELLINTKSPNSLLPFYRYLMFDRL